MPTPSRQPSQSSVSLPGLNETPPADDEFELTVLGKGVGESCVVHLGHQRWMIVDSFNESSSGISTETGRRETRTVPTAAAYLERLQVDPAAVELIVITHFHADHYRGMDLLHDRYAHATLAVTSAMSDRKFVSVFGSKGPGELRKVGETVIRAADRKLGPRGFTNGLVLTDGATQLVLDQGSGIEVNAIAPSNEAAFEASRALALLLDAGGSEANITNYLRDDNRTSIALHIRACGQAALLGGDVVAYPPRFGWGAVVDNERVAGYPKASIVKVPHHGSAGAHDDDMWTRMVTENPELLLAPFSSQNVPRSSDLKRMIAIGRLWQAAPSTPPIVDEWTAPRSDLARPTGIIQARRSGDAPWQIGIELPAHLVTSPS